VWYWAREKHPVCARLHTLAAVRAPECNFAWFYHRVEMLNWLHRRVEVTGHNEDGVWFACNEIEEPLLQRLKKLPLPVVGVDVDVEGIYLDLLVHNLH